MSNSSTAKDLTAGTVGGIAQVLVGQPFDIVKVRMQTAEPGTYSGMVDCAGKILKKEGSLAFYKGTLTPLLGIGVCVSIQFGALEYAKRVFAQRNVDQQRVVVASAGAASAGADADGKLLTPAQLVASGAFAGVANGFVSGPVEHIRIRLQTQPDTARLYNGPWDAMRKIWAQRGVAGIYKGQVATFGRESFGYASYFLCYETLMQREMTAKGIKREQVPATHAVLYGAAAGYALWFTIYPIDVIKSRMQTDGFTPSSGQKYTSTLNCIRSVWAAEGINAFTRGLIPTLIRSPFANGATFVAFELAMRVLNGGNRTVEVP